MLPFMFNTATLKKEHTLNAQLDCMLELCWQTPRASICILALLCVVALYFKKETCTISRSRNILGLEVG